MHTYTDDVSQHSHTVSEITNAGLPNPLLLRTIGRLFAGAIAVVFAATIAMGAPRPLVIYHFDVDAGDSTLFVTPAGRGVLVDAGNPGYGKVPVLEFLNRLHADGELLTLEFAIVTHYDTDHQGGMDEVLNGGWYPETAVLDRGNDLLPEFNASCTVEDVPVLSWGTAASMCSSPAACNLLSYFAAADAGGKRQVATPGRTFTLDGVTFTIMVANATDADGNTVDVDFPGRRQDCAANDLSVGLLVSYGNFEYLIAGDLTGNPEENVADVEALLADELGPIDVYHVNHHGANTSTSPGLLQVIEPTVAVISHGHKHGHPKRRVVRDLKAHGATIFTTNKNPDGFHTGTISADKQAGDRDGTIQINVYQQSYRVWTWQNGAPTGAGRKFLIK